MMNAFRLFVVLLCLCSVWNPLKAQWVSINEFFGTSTSALVVSPNGLGGSNLFAGNGQGVSISIDNGTNWNATSTGFPANVYVTAMAVSFPNLFAGTSNNGVFLSTDNGANWTSVNTGLISTGILALAVSGTQIFAGTYCGAYLSKDAGTTWSAINTGLPANTSLNALVVSGQYLIGATSGGIKRRPLSEMTASVESYSSIRPMDLRLDQNYPNPFNPTTAIGFSTASDGHATSKVYNMLGQEVALLLDKEVKSGVDRQVPFNAGRLASGVYLARLEFNGMSLFRKRVLTK